MIKKTLLFSCAASICLLSGCASIVNGTHQNVTIMTPPVHGAKCILSNSKGSWIVKSTPEDVKIHQAYGDLHLHCSKINCKPATKTVESKTKGMVAGNLVFGGIVGGGIDVADGAAYHYPNIISVPMKCKKETPKKVLHARIK